MPSAANLPPAPSGCVTLLTDFGLEDHYVGVLRGVVTRIFPGARIFDITHGVRPYNVAQAAFYLRHSYPYYPEGTVHVSVVDPGVGGARRPLVASAHGHYFIAPDNGLLSRILSRADEPEVREIDPDRWGLKPLSSTFHGRDIFAPAGAWLASGKPFAEMGPIVDEGVRLWPAEPREVNESLFHAPVLNIDRFGNIVTGFRPNDLRGASSFRLRVGSLDSTQLRETFEVSADPIVLLGSSGYLELCIRKASAADKAGAKIGDRAELALDV